MIKSDPSWDGVERMADDMKKRKLGRDSQGGALLGG